MGNGPTNQSLTDLAALQGSDPLSQLLAAHQRRQQPDPLHAILALLQPSGVSRIPMANMLLPLMGGGMQMGNTAEAPPLSAEQSKMGVAQSAPFQPIADVAGLIAGSAVHPTGRAVLGSERGAVGEATAATPEFRQWFGGSKVVNESGEPLVVYHGTRRDIPGNFKTPSWFTTSPKAASRYARSEAGSNVMPVHLSIKNPADVSFTDMIHAPSGLREKLEKQGYDGMRVVVKANPLLKESEDQVWYVPFKSTQIKSAITGR